MRIGQLAEATGTTTKTLRFYEESGLLPPAERLASGYRDYAEDAVGRVGFIHRGQAAGLTLAQIRQILDIRDGGQAPCEHVRDLLDVRFAEIEQQIADLRQDAAHPDPETCSTDQVCRYL
ncbi:heavy metal-responsive transcriptional regulator [Corynebacterium aurimucosum]|uniref:heavy metal-responsive transcriptional regulator n=1 Tax=Corynebacterium aurimucosum TaxID=169292 RepID=UPI001C0F2E03|nr:heavy metal-responsive transcriptional regulator [Corynebacterium aurimucosum]MBU5653718.1 heavy metal-responsive transcriptional regulator [Corynebacterium aurimucosum]